VVSANAHCTALLCPSGVHGLSAAGALSVAGAAIWLLHGSRGDRRGAARGAGAVPRGTRGACAPGRALIRALCPEPSSGLARAQKIKQQYDTDVEPTYINADDVADKKSIYVTLVGGLIVVAFVAPMLQFFYYTGGD
jgi:hypothetical protein